MGERGATRMGMNIYVPFRRMFGSFPVWPRHHGIGGIPKKMHAPYWWYMVVSPAQDDLRGTSIPLCTVPSQQPCEVH